MLKRLGVEKGDRVVLYMPMMPIAIAAMLGCARIGAVHRSELFWDPLLCRD